MLWWWRRSINVGLIGSYTSGYKAKHHGPNHPRPMARVSWTSHLRQTKLSNPQKFLKGKNSMEFETYKKQLGRTPLYSDDLNH